MPVVLRAVLLLVSCGPVLPPPPEEPDATSYMAHFPEGAFPPVLPRDEAHEKSWRSSWRGDRVCLDCHLEGSNGAPRPRHWGVVPEALEIRCRSCHTVQAPVF